MESEERIFLDFRNGKVDIFYKRMYPQLLSYAIRRLGSDFSFWAEDCVQDSFYKAYVHRTKLTNAVLFKSFLFACIRNKVISILRHNQAANNYLESKDGEDSEEFVNSIIEQETLNLLYDAIKALPDNLQIIFNLSFVQNKKNNEIARILNISESTVKRRKSLMIKMLEQDLIKKTNNDLSALSLLYPILLYLETFM
jgi:RNA polymerase sigma factor, sigma-70 family